MEPPAQRFMINIIDLFKDFFKNLAIKLQTHFSNIKQIKYENSGKRDCCVMKSLPQPIDNIITEGKPTSHCWFIVVSNVYQPKNDNVYHFLGKCNCKRPKCWFSQFKTNAANGEYGTEFNQSKDIICMENIKSTFQKDYDRNNNSICYLKYRDFYKTNMMIEFTNTLLQPNILPAITQANPLHRTQSRERIPSADSDDSFICFLDDNEWVMQDNDEEDDIDDISDIMEPTNSSSMQNLESSNDMDKSCENLQTTDQETKKKVRFNLKPEVHVMRHWNYAYRSARMGNWEETARDRYRFQLRIDRAAAYLDPILNTSHRSSVYNNRFSD